MTLEIPQLQLDELDKSLDDNASDEILAGLQDHFGQDMVVDSYEARLRKDYYGPASRKVRCGGVLIVTGLVRNGNAIVEFRHEIDDNHRPFSEDLISRLGALAESNWPKNGWIRDYPS